MVTTEESMYYNTSFATSEIFQKCQISLSMEGFAKLKHNEMYLKGLSLFFIRSSFHLYIT